MMDFSVSRNTLDRRMEPRPFAFLLKLISSGEWCVCVCVGGGGGGAQILAPTALDPRMQDKIYVYRVCMSQ